MPRASRCFPERSPPSPVARPRTCPSTAWPRQRLPSSKRRCTRTTGTAPGARSRRRVSPRFVRCSGDVGAPGSQSAAEGTPAAATAPGSALFAQQAAARANRLASAKIAVPRAGVAQLVEQLIRNQQVDGSSPFAGSKSFHNLFILTGRPFASPPLGNTWVTSSTNSASFGD